MMRCRTLSNLKSPTIPGETVKHILSDLIVKRGLRHLNPTPASLRLEISQV